MLAQATVTATTGAFACLTPELQIRERIAGRSTDADLEANIPVQYTKCPDLYHFEGSFYVQGYEMVISSSALEWKGLGLVWIDASQGNKIAAWVAVEGPTCTDEGSILKIV